jgi:hypothetical protein
LTCASSAMPNPSLHPGPATAGVVSPACASGSIVTHRAYNTCLRGPGELERYASRNAFQANDCALFVAASAHEVQASVFGAGHRRFTRRFTAPVGSRCVQEDRTTHRSSRRLRCQSHRPASRPATRTREQSFGTAGSAPHQPRTPVQTTRPGRRHSPRLAQRPARLSHAPQRRCTAPALPSAETGWLP